MSVLPASLKLHWRGSTGGSVSSEGASYTAVYRLETNDVHDQSRVVLTYFQVNVVQLGLPYQYANDAGLTSATCQRITANRIEPSATHWEVVVEYGPRTPSEQESVDESGNPTDEPTDWRPRIWVGANLYRTPVLSARYMGGYAAGFKYPEETWLTPMNSAGVPFTNPPLEEDAAMDWLILKTNVVSFDNDERELRRNTVDSAGFSFSHRGISGKVGAFCAKIRRITAEPKVWKGIDYVEVGYEIDIASRHGHRHSTLDVGTVMRACDTDPDGRGSDVGQSTSPYPPASPRLRAPTDLHGERIGEKFLLDGAGGPLNVCDDESRPFYGEWRTHLETPFNTTPILKNMID